MNRARSFLYVCLGVLALAAAYHLGATNAVAQAPGNPIAATSNGEIYTANGDVYTQIAGGPAYVFRYDGNVFGGATPAVQKSWGQLKVEHR